MLRKTLRNKQKLQKTPSLPSFLQPKKPQPKNIPTKNTPKNNQRKVTNSTQ